MFKYLKQEYSFSFEPILYIFLNPKVSAIS